MGVRVYDDLGRGQFVSIVTRPYQNLPVAELSELAAPPLQGVDKRRSRITRLGYRAKDPEALIRLALNRVDIEGTFEDGSISELFSLSARTRYSQAKGALELALKVQSSRSLDPSDPLVLRSHQLLGMLHSIHNAHEPAVHHFLAQLQPTLGEGAPQICEQPLALPYLVTPDQDQLTDAVSRAKATPALGTALFDLGRHLQRVARLLSSDSGLDGTPPKSHGALFSSIDVFQLAVKVQERVIAVRGKDGVNNFELARTLQAQGNSYRSLGIFSEAEECFQESLEHLGGAQGPNAERRAGVFWALHRNSRDMRGEGDPVTRAFHNFALLARSIVR